jgi:apolipoprotein N-acyltransferase
VLDRDMLTAAGARATDRAIAAEPDTDTAGAGWATELPFMVRVIITALSGLSLGFAFEPYGIWPLAFVGIAGLTVATYGVRTRRAFGLGYVFGLAMLAISINWVRVIASYAVIALIGFEALFFGVLGIAIAVLTRARWWPVLVAAAWVGVEFCYGRFPFGGFGWTRTAYTAVDTPLAGMLPFIGVAGVSFLVPLLGQGVAWLAVTVPATRPAPTRRLLTRSLLPPLALWIAVCGLGAGLRGWNPDPPDGTGVVAQVGIVQGNVPGAGIAAMGRMRTVTANHVRETERLMSAVDSGRYRQPDFVLWPENSTDIDPTLDPITADQVQSAADAAGVPIFVGAVMNGPGEDERQTSGLWWDPDSGIQARYDKRNLVPFGEWIPFRDQLLPVLPILELVGAQSIAGEKPGALRVPLSVGGGPERQVVVGDVICFELAYDRTVYDVITAGSQLFMVQSNNATYTGTGQVEQQFAITRARAMETRREIAVSTTNGVSGFISRDGTVQWQTQQRTAASTVMSMPLREEITPAVRVAPWLERGLALAALVGCAGVVITGRRHQAR